MKIEAIIRLRFETSPDSELSEAALAEQELFRAEDMVGYHMRKMKRECGNLVAWGYYGVEQREDRRKGYPRIVEGD